MPQPLLVSSRNSLTAAAAEQGDGKASKSGTYETWHLKGIMAEGANLHKPATVSGGGKSEISKRLEDMIKYGPVYVKDIGKDFDDIQVCPSPLAPLL